MSPRKSILVLDDSPLVLGIVRAALQHEGFDVVIASDLHTFEGLVATGAPDLILIDVNMPEAFGDDVGAVLRGARKLTVPIWLFSNLDDSTLEARSRAAGLDGFISKRAGLDVLVQRVVGILGAHAVS